MFKKYLFIIIPVIATAVCSLFYFTTMDKKVADWFQLALPSTEESESVVMLNVDDDSISQIGSWPISRKVYAQSLLTLKELGAESVVFDLSFVDKSESKVDESYVKNQLPAYIDAGFESINQKVIDYMGYLAGSNLTEEDAEAVTYDILDTTQIVKDSLETNISYVIESQDKNLARAIRYFDNTYLTLTFDDASTLTREQEEYLSGYIALDNIDASKDHITPEYDHVLPAIQEFLRQGKSAGFVNADPDKDNFMRRVNLIVKRNGKYYGQLVFVPILEHFGNPKVVITDNYVLLKNCRFPNMVIKDIKIPRGEDGQVILKYPKKNFIDYNHISLWNVYRVNLLEQNLAQHVEFLSESGFFDYFDGNDPAEAYGNAKYIQDALIDGSDEFSDEMFWSYRTDFFGAYEAFLNGNTEEILIEMNEGDTETIQMIKDTFATCREVFNDLMAARESVHNQIANAMCIIGTNATSTTDYGVNMYEEHYPNPGVHYTLSNMIYSQDFVDDCPFIITLIIALVLCIAYSFATHKIKSTGKQIIIGVMSLVATIIILLIVFMITRVYLGAVIPVTALLISFITNTVIGFLTASHDKRFITNAFSQCLSKEVVNDIVANPSSFKLGGQRLEMTAMFTDIQKFSSFSELLTAGQLVALLNYYLTKMSDIIMDERGTVDKYEGDAIIALVGAPVKMDDHAQRACAAAIKMKKAEVEMNKEICEIASKEKPENMDEELYSAFKTMVENKKVLFTRIGLNSGEMIAGYMGSENKKNYTMMGNNVNLASRLEGVNKQYHTGGILISEATRVLLGERFLVRSLDRVRVVNVNTPIRLYELIDEKELAHVSKLAYYEKWEEAMKVFESRDYTKALDMFKALSEQNGDDATCKYYISLLETFFVQNKYPTDKDDFGVEFNEEEFVFRLLQK